MNRLRNGKRMLAMLLSIALVAASGDFTLNSYAENDTDDKFAALSEADGSDIADGLDNLDNAESGTGDGIDITDSCKADSDGVLQVETDAFAGLTTNDKVSLTIPEEVTTINAGVFDIHTQITKVVIPEGSQLTTIGAKAFAGSEIEALTIPDGTPLSVIGDEAFKGSALAEIVFGSNEESGGDSGSDTPFGNNVGNATDNGIQAVMLSAEEPEEQNYITWGKSAFEDCEHLKTVELNNQTERIAEGMFKGCTALEGILFPASVKSVEAKAFMGCTALKDVTISEACEAIGVSAFEGCAALEEIDMPKAVEQISNRALAGCANMKKVYIRQHKDDAWESSIQLPSDLFDDISANGSGSETGGSDVSANNPGSETGGSDVSANNPGSETGGSDVSANNLGSETGGSEGGQPSGSVTENGEGDGPASGSGGAGENSGQGTGGNPVEDPDASITEGQDPTLYGYAGTVRAYAKQYGYKYESLAEKNDYFTVDPMTYRLGVSANGETILENALHAGTPITDAKLPASVRIIPAGIFNHYTNITTLEIPEDSELETIEIETDGTGAFEGSSITSLTLPQGVTEIPDNTFKGSGLVGITATGVTKVGESAFENCEKLITFPLSDEADTLGQSAFGGCTSLTSVTIPKRLTVIPDSAFSGCTALEAVIFPEGSSCVEIGQSAFAGCRNAEFTEIDIPASVTVIGAHAFYDCSHLEEVIIRQQANEAPYECSVVLSLAEEDAVFNQDSLLLRGYDGTVKAFVEQYNEDKEEGKQYRFESLFEGNEYFRVDGEGILRLQDGVEPADLPATVELLESAEIIPAGIFDAAPQVTKIVVPDKSRLREIRQQAFYGSQITAFRFPDGVTAIGNMAFAASAIETVTFGEQSRLETIGDNAFSMSRLKGIAFPGGDSNGIEIGNMAFYKCEKLETVSLTHVRQIGTRAFAGSSLLRAITWGETAVWGAYVFEGCETLTAVTLPDSMAVVPTGLFKGCTKLNSVTFSEDCTEIGQEAFSGCSALKTLSIPARVGKIAARAFAECRGLIIVTIYQKEKGAEESNISIADDAFPAMTLTMKGYDGAVERYAAMRGYTFVSLFASYTVQVTVLGGHGKAVVSKTTARSGETIEVTVTPDERYRLNASVFTCNGTAITRLKETLDRSQTFTFLMPDENAEVLVGFELDQSYGDLTYSFEPVRNMPYTWDADKKTLTFARAGLAGRLIVNGSKANPGSWALSYSSNKPKVAVVDSAGVIYATGQGSATLKAALQSDTSKSVTFKVEVLEDLTIGAVELKVSGYGSRARWDREVIKADDEEEKGPDNTYVVLEYAKYTLQQSEQNFSVALTVEAEGDDGGMDYFVQSAWKSSNTNMVTVDQATVYDNTNVVRIKKGVTGEACVTVTVGKVKRSVIIRVIDSTPRLVQKTLTLNARSTDAKAAFELLPVYEYEVDAASLAVVQAVKADGRLYYEPWAYAEISNTHPDANKYYMTLTEEGRKAIAVKSANLTYDNIYIQGSCVKGTEKETFYIPVKSVILTNKVLKPTVKLSGKINLFYNGHASADNRGVVTIAQSLKDLEVAEYRLLSAENYKAGKYKDPNMSVDPEDDAFAGNFAVEDSQIVRRDNELRTVKNKAVTGGYLGILYDGYNEFCWVKITVPTKNTKPGYVLSKTKATVSAGSTGYEIVLKLLDKKTKQEISLADLGGEEGGISINHSASRTTLGLFYDFKEGDTGSASWVDISDNTIHLKLDMVQNGKATLNVQMADWSAPVAYTFKVSVAKGSPKVKAKSSTLTLNLYSQSDTSTELTVTPDDVTLKDEAEIEFLGRGEEPDITLLILDGRLFASGGSETGNYRFRVTPSVQYVNEQTGKAAPFTVTVKVVEKTMSMRLKTSTVTLNRLYWTLDERTVKYTVQNMPTEDGIPDGTLSVEGINAAKAVEGDLEFTMQEGTLCVRQKSPGVPTGTYKFRVSDLETTSGVKIAPFTITVRIIEKAAKLNAKASGSINVLDKNSAIKYTLTTSNVNIKLDADNLRVRELNTTNGRNTPYTDDDTGEEVLQHFTYTFDGDDAKSVVKVTAKREEDTGTAQEPGAETSAKTDSSASQAAYKLQIGVVADKERGSVVWSKDLNIKLKQMLPKIKTDVESATLYAGVSAGSAGRSQDFILQKTTVEEAVISSVRLAGSNSDSLKQAFKVSAFDPDKHKVTVTLLRPDLLKPDTTYTVRLEALIDGQIANTAGSQFTVKIKVVN